MQNQKGNISVIVSFIIVVCIIGLIVYALMHSAGSTPESSSVQGVATNTSTTPTAAVKEQPTPSNKSMGQVAKKGDTLIMNYTGRLTNGTVFDSNVDPKFNHVQPFEFVLGAGQVIAGWDEGLVGMKVGEKKTLTVPPNKGYGSASVGSIPPNSTLIFDVELLGIK